MGTNAASGCSRYREELALLATGDMAGADDAGVHAHLDGCAACAGLLAELAADQDLFGQAAAAAALPQADDGGSLAAPVLARLATESHASSHRPARARRRTDAGLLAFGRAAAAVIVVISAALLGVSALPQDEALAPSVAGLGEAQTMPVQVRRAAGYGLELSWQGDGREAPGASRPIGTYRVLASSSARDFSAARPVEVAGSHLVLGVDVPSARGSDRSVTFFRVE